MGKQVIGLGAGRKKQSYMEPFLTPLGPVIWRKFAPMAIRSYPETSERVICAMKSAIKQPKTKVGQLLKRGLLTLQYNGARRIFERDPQAIAAVWNGLNGTRRVFADAAQDAGCKRLLFELGPLPHTLTVDPNGVNFHNSLPRRPDPYLTWYQNMAPHHDMWRSVARKISQRQALKPSQQEANGLPDLSAPFVFVPLQVPGDSQLRLFGGLYRTVPELIAMLCKMAPLLPEGWHIRVKEHPSSPVSFADLIPAREARIHIDNSTDTFSQVQAAQLVLTTNSSVGLEAMFFEKPVVAVGDCFWAIQGIAHDARDPAALREVFDNPSLVSFDAQSRSAFLEFLCQEYYLNPNEPLGAKHKIERRLSGDWGFGDA